MSFYYLPALLVTLYSVPQLPQLMNLRQAAKAPEKIDNTAFIIYNKLYSLQKMTVWYLDKEYFGSSQHKNAKGDCWILEPAMNYPEYHYVEQCNDKELKLQMSESSEGWSKPYITRENQNPAQLWKFKREGNFFRITNKQFPTWKLGKTGNDDGDMVVFNGAEADDQLWELEPRFSTSLDCKVLWGYDNREGSTPITEQLHVTKGFEKSSSSESSSDYSMSESIEASMGLAMGPYSAKASGDFKQDFHSAMSSSSSSYGSNESTVSYTAPAHHDYKVIQCGSSISDEIGTNSLKFWGKPMILERTDKIDVNKLDEVYFADN